MRTPSPLCAVLCFIDRVLFQETASLSSAFPTKHTPLHDCYTLISLIFATFFIAVAFTLGTYNCICDVTVTLDCACAPQKPCVSSLIHPPAFSISLSELPTLWDTTTLTSGPLIAGYCLRHAEVGRVSWFQWEARNDSGQGDRHVDRSEARLLVPDVKAKEKFWKEIRGLLQGTCTQEERRSWQRGQTLLLFSLKTLLLIPGFRWQPSVWMKVSPSHSKRMIAYQRIRDH